MTNNTIPNVPRELLADLLGNDHDKRIMAERHLLAMLANAPSPANHVEDVRAMVAAPSPAGGGGLEVVSNWVLFDAEADKPYIKKMLPEGFLAFFDCEEDARRAKANNPRTDYKRIDRVKAEDAQAIIDGLRGEVERLQMQLAACGVVALANTIESAGEARQMHPDYMSASCSDVADAVDREIALRTERDQQARRIGELEGLLRSCLPALSDGGCAALANRIDAALAAVCAAAQNIASTSEHSGS